LARVPDETPPTPPGFLLRNQLLAALTVATIVVEAGLRSGAQSTAAAARRLGRPLLVVPHPPWEPRGAGCAALLARGARAITCARDVLSVITPLFASAPPRLAPPLASDPPDHPGLDDGERAIFAALGEEPAHIDEVCERTSLTPKVILATLLTLTLRAVVVEGPAGFFRRAPARPRRW